jgi:hypothetical protein
VHKTCKISLKLYVIALLRKGFDPYKIITDLEPVRLKVTDPSRYGSGTIAESKENCYILSFSLKVILL